jgi:hypothetical protein
LERYIRKRDYFYSTKDKCLVKCNFPKFLQKSNDPKKADLMSRPMRYHSTADKMKMIGIKTKQKKKVKE